MYIRYPVKNPASFPAGSPETRPETRPERKKTGEPDSPLPAMRAVRDTAGS